MKRKLAAWWRVTITTRRQLVAEADRLQRENSDLRERLSAQQHARTQAENQAEELREQKERLRAKSAQLKKDLDAQKRVLEQAQEKIASLRQELDSQERR